MTASTHSIQRATILLALLVLLSKIIGFGREMIIAYQFGTSAEYDTYLLAVSVPVALYVLIGYAVTNLVIPEYGLARSGADTGSLLNLLWRNINFSLAVIAAVAAGLALGASRWIPLIAPGLDPNRLPEAVFIARISSLVVVFGLLEAVFRSIVNAEKQFIIPAFGPICANVVMIASIVSFSGRISTHAILYGLVGGYLVQMLVVFIPFVRTGVMAFFQGKIVHRGLQSFGAMALVILIIEGSWQVLSIIDRYFASSMEAGIISALGYAYLLISLPTSIFAYALSTVIFPHFTDAVASGDVQRSSHLLTRGITVSLLMATPIIVIIWVGAEGLVTVALRRGAFDQQSVTHTSELLKYFSLGLAGQFLLWTISRAYYAARRFGVLLLQVAAVLIIKIVCAAAAVAWLGYTGLAVSSSISYLAGAAILVLCADRTLARLDWKALVLYVVKLCVASAATGLAAHVLYRRLILPGQPWLEMSGWLALVVVGAGLVFMAIAYMLHISDIRDLMNALVGRKDAHVRGN